MVQRKTMGFPPLQDNSPTIQCGHLLTPVVALTPAPTGGFAETSVQLVFGAFWRHACYSFPDRPQFLMATLKAPTVLDTFTLSGKMFQLLTILNEKALRLISVLARLTFFQPR
jgi:hypothetical protein